MIPRDAVSQSRNRISEKKLLLDAPRSPEPHVCRIVYCRHTKYNLVGPSDITSQLAIARGPIRFHLAICPYPPIDALPLYTSQARAFARHQRCRYCPERRKKVASDARFFKLTLCFRYSVAISRCSPLRPLAGKLNATRALLLSGSGSLNMTSLLPIFSKWLLSGNGDQERVAKGFERG